MASRPGEDEREEQLLEELLGQPRAVLVRPAPLGPAALGRLLSAQTGEQPDEIFVDACVAATEGNLLLVRELVQVAGGIESSAEGAERGVSSARARLRAGCSRGSAGVLFSSRWCGQSRCWARTRMCAASPAEAPRRGGERRARRSEATDVLTGERPIEFVHPIARSAIYAAIPAGERARLHAVAAALLREEERPPSASRATCS